MHKADLVACSGFACFEICAADGAERLDAPKCCLVRPQPLQSARRVLRVLEEGVITFDPVVCVLAGNVPNGAVWAQTGVPFADYLGVAVGLVRGAYLAEFPFGADASEPHSHPGAELIYVVRGALALTVDETVVELDEGDAAYFESDVEHSYRENGESACSAIVVLVA